MPATLVHEIPAKLVLLSGSHGSGNDPTRLCVMEAVDYVSSGGFTDSPACACPVLTSFMIRINDAGVLWKSDQHRTDVLRPYILRLVGTRGTREVERRRMFIVADFAVRWILPLVCDARPKLVQFAADLRALPAIVDETTALAGRDLAQKVRSADAAYAAAYAAAAAAYAAAYAAAAAAADAAAAYAAAAAAADAAAYAAYAKQKAKILQLMLACVDRMIAAGDK